MTINQNEIAGIFLSILLLHLPGVLTHIERNNGDEFRAEFNITQSARLNGVLIYQDDVTIGECLYACVSHLNCVSVNYNDALKRCELSNQHYEDESAHQVDVIGWMHYDTPKKVHGGFTPWFDVTTCSKSCGGGVLSQGRTCTNPKPRNGGRYCEGVGRRTVHCNTISCLDWTLQTSDVCIRPTVPPYGNITIGFHGPLTKLKLVHKSGKLSCTNGTSYNWRCIKGPKLQVVITSQDDFEVIFPNATLNGVMSYELPPYHKNSKEIIFDSPVRPMNVTIGDVLRVWLNRDLLKNNNHMNTGIMCMDVYAETVRCFGQDNGCCTPSMPCYKDEGDCDGDSDCYGDLRCGENNCPWHDSDDCCY